MKHDSLMQFWKFEHSTFVCAGGLSPEGGNLLASRRKSKFFKEEYF